MTPEEHAALDLYLTFEVGPHRDHFTAELYRLISKADFSHRRRLTLPYPLHVAMYEEWMRTEDRFAFYDKYNCKTNFKPEEEEVTVSKIERDSMRAAEIFGWWQRKFISPSHNGVPDRILAKSNRVLFIEFKQPLEELSPVQVDEIKEMIDQGLEVHVCDSVDDVKSILGIPT